MTIVSSLSEFCCLQKDASAVLYQIPHGVLTLSESGYNRRLCAFSAIGPSTYFIVGDRLRLVKDVQARSHETLRFQAYHCQLDQSLSSSCTSYCLTEFAKREKAALEKQVGGLTRARVQQFIQAYPQQDHTLENKLFQSMLRFMPHLLEAFQAAGYGNINQLSDCLYQDCRRFLEQTTFDDLYSYAQALAEEKEEETKRKLTQHASEFLMTLGLTRARINELVNYELPPSNLPDFFLKDPSRNWNPRILTLVERTYETTFGLQRVHFQTLPHLNSFDRLLEALQGSPVALIGRGIGKHIYTTPSDISENEWLGDRRVKKWPPRSPKSIGDALSIITLIGAKRSPLRENSFQEVVYFVDPTEDDERNSLFAYKISYASIQDRLVALIGNNAHLRAIWSQFMQERA